MVTFQLLTSQLEPLTEQQLMGLCNLQQSSQQAEDALSQGMEALQQSLAETLAGSLSSSGSSGNVANYMGQMAMAMGKLGTLENFLCQVNNFSCLKSMIPILELHKPYFGFISTVCYVYFLWFNCLTSSKQVLNPKKSFIHVQD